MVKNQAFVFIKPHAVNDKVKALVKETLEAKEITIAKEGTIEAEEIDKKQLIDKHYYAIAAKATLKKPSELNVPKEKFKDFFGKDWEEVLKDGKAYNAKEACEKLGVDAAGLEKMWGICKGAKKMVKFGGGFYCGELPAGEDNIYVFNGFFMSMRDKFVAPGVSIYYYVVDWESKNLSWEDFRGQVLGPTDPSTAPPDSCRGAIMAKWQELGLASEPNTGDNGVHASASPFEALAERANWLGYRPDRDPFGKLLLKAGVSKGLIKEWSNDPQVTFGVIPMTTSLFDSLEDTDSDYCLALCQMIASFAGPPKEKKSGPQEKELAKLREQVAMYEGIAKAVSAIQAFSPPDDKPSAKGKAKAKAKAEAKKGKGKGKGKGKRGDDD